MAVIAAKFDSGRSAYGRHREERSDAAIHQCKMGRQKWIASLLSQ
jgi:hypothetical protein